MKKLISKMILMFAIAISFSAVVDAQIVVKVRPPQPVIKVRPVAPSPAHVWVGGEWVWVDGKYNYKDGYWERPSHGNRVWVSGRWKHTKLGWVWVPGHWRK